LEKEKKLDKKLMFLTIYLLILHAVTWALLFQDQMWKIKQDLSQQITCELNPDSCEKSED
jgi:hypothetical protein